MFDITDLNTFSDAIPWPIAAGLGAWLGLVIGSYLATVFVRWPQGRSANEGRSRCDACGRQLSWFELVPVVSWLLLCGRCRTCGRSIDMAHSVIELLCGVAGAAAFVIGLPLLAPMAWLLIVLSFFDANYLWLPDRLVLALAVAGLLAPSDYDLHWRIAGGVIGFVALWFIATGFQRLTGKVGLGGGDAKLFGAIGLWCGARELPVIMLLACLIGFADAFRRHLRCVDHGPMRLPLGAYLAASTIFFMAMDQSIVLQLRDHLLVLIDT